MKNRKEIKDCKVCPSYMICTAEDTPRNNYGLPDCPLIYSKGEKKKEVKINYRPQIVY